MWTAPRGSHSQQEAGEKVRYEQALEWHQDNWTRQRFYWQERCRNGITWNTDSTMLRAIDTKSQAIIMMVDNIDGPTGTNARLYANDDYNDVANAHRLHSKVVRKRHQTAMLNLVLPEGLRLHRSKNDRYYLTGLTDRDRVPMHYGLGITRGHAGNLAGWVMVDPRTIPQPHPYDVKKAHRRMVKRWASGPYGVSPCGLCITDGNGRLHAHTFDDGAKAREHLLEHMLLGSAPLQFLAGIVNDYTHVAWTDVSEWPAAIYQIATAYAYDVLRNTLQLRWAATQ